MSTTMSERQKREKEYYDQYAKTYDVSKHPIDLSPIERPMQGLETRPWNSYWATYAFAISDYAQGKKLLDFGSGPGDNAFRFSKIGYQVFGFDISESNVEIARKIFSLHQQQANFQVSTAEVLPYQNEQFDIIVGIDILHHVDIALAMKECFRVLKDGGKAYFREPVEVPLLDFLRNTKIVKYFAPKTASFENHITEDERKLNCKDEDIIKSVFPHMKKHYYFLFARFDKFYRRGDDPSASVLEKLDYYLMKFFPFIKRLGGTVIYELQK
jgi:ubiquinone/menaquinone biosynthesis C-methylase UbiE